MNRPVFFRPVPLLGPLVLPILLAACTGSNNLSENPQAGVTRNSCTGDSCLRFEFTVDPVSNLNYRCGSVVDVTTSIGTGACPSGTVATFYLRAPEGKREVVLGTAKIDPARGLTGAEATDQPLVRITPAMLTTTGLTTLDSTNAASALNITRLLQALREQNAQGQPVEPYVAEAPVNRIVISDAMKRGIDKLEQDIAATAFADTNSLETLLAPWLTANTKDSTYPAIALISTDEARTRLTRTLNTIKAGAYWGSPALSLFGIDTSGLPGLNAANLNLGIQSNNTGSGQYAVMQIHVINDRDNRSAGQGMYWSGEATSVQDASNLYTRLPYSQMRLQSDQAGFDPLTDLIQNYRWNLLDNATGTPQAEISFDTGKLLRDTLVAGSESTYRSYMLVNNQQTVPPAHLGTWSQRPLVNGTPASTASVSGTDTLYKTSNADTFFDRNVWRVAATVPAGSAYIFPLSLKLSFKYGSACTPNNPAACTQSLSAEPIGITLLANGNIVSDVNRDCNGTLDANLRDAAGQQEHRIGYVRAAYQSADRSSAYVAPTLLIGNPAIFGEAYNGVQISTQSPAPRVKLDVAGLLNSVNGQGTVVLSDASSPDATQTGSAPAQWVNVYNLLLGLRSQGAALTSAEAARLERAGGVVTAALADCYSIKTR